MGNQLAKRRGLSAALRLAALVLLFLSLGGCGGNHSIEVPEHPGPKPTSPPQKMAPVEAKPRPPDHSNK